MSDIKTINHDQGSRFLLLSIRLKTDGFSFSIYNTTTKEYHSEEIETDSSLSLTANLKRTFKEQEFLSKPYRQKNVVFVGTRYLLLPLELFEDEQKETLFYHSHVKKENEIILYDIVKKMNIVVLYAIDKSAYDSQEWDKELGIQSETSLSSTDSIPLIKEWKTAVSKLTGKKSLSFFEIIKHQYVYHTSRFRISYTVPPSI